MWATARLRPVPPSERRTVSTEPRAFRAEMNRTLTRAAAPSGIQDSDASRRMIHVSRERDVATAARVRRRWIAIDSTAIARTDFPGRLARKVGLE